MSRAKVAINVVLGLACIAVVVVVAAAQTYLDDTKGKWRAEQVARFRELVVKDGLTLPATAGQTVIIHVPPISDYDHGVCAVTTSFEAGVGGPLCFKPVDGEYQISCAANPRVAHLLRTDRCTQ